MRVCQAACTEPACVLCVWLFVVGFWFLVFSPLYIIKEEGEKKICHEKTFQVTMILS